MSISLELLNEKLILNELGVASSLLNCLEILPSIDSTNTYLLKKAKTATKYAVFAEQQTAGRGQFNRKWISSFGKHIALSLLWHLPHKPDKLTGLSLVIGIAIVQALKEYGLEGIKLKWPNDIVFQQKKLAGVLIETQASNPEFCAIIIGVGLNLYSPITHSHSIAINQSITDIYSIQKNPPQRNRLAGLLLKNILNILHKFERNGFTCVVKAWQNLDSLKGKSIQIQTSQELLQGIAQGINAKGQLQMTIKGKLHCFNSGEIHINKNYLVND
jgi:BirA family transcriptional regulator, biotin operon repressor / biotin---[acetyl-CoA-carboxylase] ligase